MGPQFGPLTPVPPLGPFPLTHRVRQPLDRHPPVICPTLLAATVTTPLPQPSTLFKLRLPQKVPTSTTVPLLPDLTLRLNRWYPLVPTVLTP